MTELVPVLDPSGIARLREALALAGYTTSGVAARIGASGDAARRRGDLRATLHATSGGDRLDTWIRLFGCGLTGSTAAVAAALDPLPLADALAVGLVEPAGDGVRAGIALEPYGDWWLVSDLPTWMRGGAPLPAGYVLGTGGAATTLAQATMRRPVGTALDLGTGCGIQSLHLSTHAQRITATDISLRALRFAATTAALNGLDWELLRGALTVPVQGRRFDLVVSNPPFVVGPGGPVQHVYRDSGRAGDAVCAELVASMAGLLAPGGVAQFLANWLHVAGEDWSDRVAGWVAGTGLDAWIVQREVSDPISYVDLWLTDAAESSADRPSRAAAWLDWFDTNKVEAVGLGLVTLRAGGHADPTVRVEELRQPVDPPLGAHVAAWFDRGDWLRVHQGPALLDARLRTADGLQLRQEATRGADGWGVDRQVLALPDGLRWSEQVDPLVLALVGGCDGTVALHDQVDLLAVAHDVDPALLAEVAAPIVAHLVERGILLPADAPPSPAA